MTEVSVETATEATGAEAQANTNSGSLIIELRATQTSPSGRLFELFPRSSQVEDRRLLPRINWLFLFIVVVPTLLSVSYYGFIAADQYVTETKFFVRSAASSGAIGLSSLMQSRGLSRAEDETYAVDEYIVSPDVFSLIDQDGTLRSIFGRAEADFLSRFPGPFSKGNMEHLQKHLKSFISVRMEATSGISTLQVSTFRPEDSLLLTRKLMERGEDFVNQLNVRANADAMNFAESVQKEAVERLRDVDQRLSNYRNRELVVDPTKEISVSIDQLSKLALQISELQASVAQTAAQAPNSPQIASVKQQIKALKEEYDRGRGLIVGADGSLSSKLSQYQRLVLEKELASKAVASAAIGIEQARQEAKSRRIYLQNIVSPRQPDMPTRPMRLLMIAITVGLSLCGYMLVRTFYNTVLEHQA